MLSNYQETLMNLRFTAIEMKSARFQIGPFSTPVSSAGVNAADYIKGLCPNAIVNVVLLNESPGYHYLRDEEKSRIKSDYLRNFHRLAELASKFEGGVKIFLNGVEATDPEILALLCGENLQGQEITVGKGGYPKTEKALSFSDLHNMKNDYIAALKLVRKCARRLHDNGVDIDSDISGVDSYIADFVFGIMDYNFSTEKEEDITVEDLKITFRLNKEI